MENCARKWYLFLCTIFLRSLGRFAKCGIFCLTGILKCSLQTHVKLVFSRGCHRKRIDFLSQFQGLLPSKYHFFNWHQKVLLLWGGPCFVIRITQLILIFHNCIQIEIAIGPRLLLVLQVRQRKYWCTDIEFKYSLSHSPGHEWMFFERLIWRTTWKCLKNCNLTLRSILRLRTSKRNL